MEDTKKRKIKALAKDTGLFTISSFGSKILIFLLTPLYTSILTTQEYGVADLINTTILFLYPVLTLAIADATLRYALDKAYDKNEVFVISTVFTLLSSAVLIILKPLICLIDPAMETFWAIFVINYFLFNVHNYFSNFVKGLGKTTLFAIQGLIHTITIIASNILFLIVLKTGLKGYLYSILIGYTIPILIMFFCAKLYKYGLPFRINTKLLKDMLKYSIPMVPTILAWAINTSIDKYMIIWMHGLGPSGVYSVAHKIPTIVTTILTIFIQAWQISAITNHGSKDESQFYSMIYKCLDFVSVVGCMLVLLICKQMARVLFAKDFYVAWKCVPMLVIAAMFSSHSGFLAAAYRAEKKTKSLFVSVMVGAIVNIVLNYLLIEPLGGLGAAIATMTSFFVVWLMRVILVQRIVIVRVPILETVVSYIILIVSALLITFEVKHAEILIITGFLVICVLKRDTIRFLWKSMTALLKQACNKERLSRRKHG